MNKVTALIVMMLAFSIPQESVAQPPTPQQIYAIGMWWLNEGGPKLQEALGHEGFRAARHPVPVYIANLSDTTVEIKLKTAECKWGTYRVGPYEQVTIDCKNTYEGAAWQLQLGHDVSQLTGGRLFAIERGWNGALYVADRTPAH